jgi:hypothetical protein
MSDSVSTNYEVRTTMIVNMQLQQQNEDTYGNEAKRRRITDAGAHLKVWQCEFSYVLNEEKEEKGIPAGEEVIRIVQEPIQVKEEEEAQVQVQQQDQQQPPVQCIGRTVVIETTGRRIYRGRIGSLFDLNGERAIHIETDGENLIFTASQVYDLKLLHDPVNEEMLSPIPRRDEEVVVIEDDGDGDEELQQITQSMEVIHILSDNDEYSECDSDAITQQLEDNDDYQDDFPDVPFQPAREQQPQQPQQPQHQEQEDNCCAVCLDATDVARNFVSLDCGHQFHFACIMGNMANGGNNRNHCPLCRSAVLQAYDVHNLDEVQRMRMEEMLEHAASQNQHLQDELSLTRQHREDLTAEYVRVMSMNMQIGLRHHEERDARDALERRAYICGLNERIVAIVANGVNNDIRQNGAAMHMERQIRELCMSFGCMAYDAQYDEHQDHDEHQDQEHEDPYADAMEVD